jgi:hypothetical protein
MTIKRRIAYSVVIGLIFDTIGFVTLGIADGVWVGIPFSPQYLLLTYVLPILKIDTDAPGVVKGWLWLFVVPWLVWIVVLFLFLTVWTNVTRNDKRAA